MKLVKKILTSFCALTIAMTVASSFTIVANAAEGEVTAYPVVSVDTEGKTVDIELHVKNIPSTVDGSTQYVTTLKAAVDVSSFSTINLATLSEDDYYTWEDTHYKNNYSTGIPTIGATDVPAGYFAYSLTFTNGALAQSAGATISDDIKVFTLNDIPLTDDALANGFEVKLRGNDHAQGFSVGTAKRGQTYCNTSIYTCSSVLSTAVVESAKWTPAKTEVIPTATATGEVEGVKIGESYTGDDDATDVAAAVAAGLLGEEGKTYTGVKWTVTDDQGTTKTHVQELNISGAVAVKVGLAIQGLAQDAVSAIKAVLQ